MSRYDQVQSELHLRPRKWLVTGAAGFIGSNLVEKLLSLGQNVVGLDNFSTGYQHNLDDVRDRVGTLAWQRLHFMKADIRDLASCESASEGVDIVLHQAALGSVPRSITDPIATNQSNVDGFLNMLVAARDAGVKCFVFAASSSTYGDHPGLPKVEDQIGKPLSPYAVTKYVNELYATVFARCFGVRTVGLRYFNVFGRRQDPAGAYAAVLPKWVGNLLGGRPCEIFGDGETSRDFCYIDNAVQANILAATAGHDAGQYQVYNVACGGRTTLNELYSLIKSGLSEFRDGLEQVQPEFRDFRTGDVRHSQADITRISSQLGYSPSHTAAEGLREAIAWYAMRETSMSRHTTASASLGV